MKNVAFIITKSEVGGAQTWVSEMSNTLKDECNLFLITSELGWLTENSENFNKTLILPGVKKHLNIFTLWKIIFFFKRNNINTVIASSANAGVYARLAKLFCKFKCIYVSHGWSCIYNGGSLRYVFCKIEKYLSKITDVIWCVSESDRVKALDFIGIDDSKIIMVPNTVTPMPKRVNKKIGYNVLFVGRLTHPKRPELLAEVISKKNNYKLDIIGGGENLESLKEKYRGYSNIRFLGEVNQFADYQCYDLFALISDSEGLPMSGLEAHTAGLPLLLSDVGGCAELIEGNGLLTSNDEKSINENIEHIFSRYEEYSYQALISSSKYDIKNYIECYRRLILD
ncbi:exopolysaccharide biosynthesis glycosyltransferase [Kluyvera georgiana ATCC 51603]|uniref:Exopolysaccharide biosynthesis glycosyltransferase n=1 Tax=Kluyvera georgiana ATCC 51603 TaxID=1354264 RepID=A0A1B7K1T6_9ENTR|nr:glycosyltransferase [Kluyvera georgiana]OAT54108.1 exopolysaccharide biosynthesis glycosyltransferase [Kluyvera georgiana ATCC 51603]